MTKRKICVLAVAAALLLAGVGILLYPVLRTSIANAADRDLIRSFSDYIGDTAEDFGSSPASGQAEQMPFAELRAACEAYNRQLAETAQADFSAETVTQPPLRLADYGYMQEIFGYISIPAANIDMPLYLGASASNMDQGAVILGQTSLPLGGADTNCVVAGHRTWTGAIKFKGIEKLKPGDKATITNPWETLTYSVVDVTVIDANDSDKIKIQPGRDLLSVFTCTYPNIRRVLVTCERES